MTCFFLISFVSAKLNTCPNLNSPTRAPLPHHQFYRSPQTPKQHTKKKTSSRIHEVLFIYPFPPPPHIFPIFCLTHNTTMRSASYYSLRNISHAYLFWCGSTQHPNPTPHPHHTSTFEVTPSYFQRFPPLCSLHWCRTENDMVTNNTYNM